MFRIHVFTVSSSDNMRAVRTHNYYQIPVTAQLFGNSRARDEYFTCTAAYVHCCWYDRENLRNATVDTHLIIQRYCRVLDQPCHTASTCGNLSSSSRSHDQQQESNTPRGKSRRTASAENRTHFSVMPDRTMYPAR